MGDIINLRQARKRAASAEKDDDAAANRAKHGRTKAERKLTEAEAAKARKLLDGAKREPPGKK
jgi:hypothetical protein